MDRGLEIAEVAAQLNVTPDTIVNWEQGHNEPESTHGARILAFLGYCPFEDPETFGDHLRIWRWKRGLSHRQVAATSGVDPSSWQSWERGNLARRGNFLCGPVDCEATSLHPMKFGFPASCLMVLLILSGCEILDPPEVGDPAPELTAVDLAGNPFSWEDVTPGKVRLLQFYSGSCCGAQLPETNRFFLEDRTDAVSVIALNVLDSPETVRKQIDDLGLALPVALDQSRSTSGRYCLSRLPTTFLIDSDGIVRARIVGRVSREELARQVDSLLDALPDPENNKKDQNT